MRRLALKPYYDLLSSDYPDQNGSKVNEMTRKKVQEQMNIQINEIIKLSFES